VLPGLRAVIANASIPKEVLQMKLRGMRVSAPVLVRLAVLLAATTILSVGFATSAFATPVSQTTCNLSGCHSGGQIAVACFQTSTSATSTTYNVSAPGADAWAVFSAAGADITYANGTNPRGTGGSVTVANGASYTVLAVGGTGTTMGSTTLSPGGGSSTAATVTLTYASGIGGTISGSASQVIDMYSSGAAVTAVPDPGYFFVVWSDGVMTARRMDTAVTSDIDVHAVFEPIITYQLHYLATAGGTLVGNTAQTAMWGEDGATVTAVPMAGYYFAGWSDGVTSASRAEQHVTSDTSATADFALKQVTSIALRSSRTSLTHGASVALTATLKGGVPAGTRVTLQVKAPGKRTYATIGSVGTSDLGVALKSYKVAARGTYYFRVVFAGSTAFKASTSSAVKVASK
jgi:hypothetical protein